MGFCLFNNTAVAARWAQRERGVERVAIVDWDVHHGNGTEEIFLDDPIGADDLAAPGRRSTPPTPAGSRCAGPAPARASTSTSRCPPATGDDGYLHAFDARRGAGAARVRPDLLIVGAGQDALGDRPARADVDHRPGLPRAGRPRRGARRRAVRRPARRDARGRLLAAAPAAGQPRDPRGARRAAGRRSRTTRSAPTCRGRCATSSGRPSPPPSGRTWPDAARRARVLDRRRGQPARCCRRSRASSTADVVVIGGGYTGMWTAWHALDAEPGRARRRARVRPLRARPERAQRRLRVQHRPEPAVAARRLRRGGGARLGRRARARPSTPSARGARPRAWTRGTGAAASCASRPPRRRTGSAPTPSTARPCSRRRRGGARALRLPGLPRRRVRARAARTVHPARLAFGLRERLIARGRTDPRGQPRHRHPPRAGRRDRAHRERARARPDGRVRDQRGERHAARRCATG